MQSLEFNAGKRIQAPTGAHGAPYGGAAAILNVFFRTRRLDNSDASSGGSEAE